MGHSWLRLEIRSHQNTVYMAIHVNGIFYQTTKTYTQHGTIKKKTDI